MVNVRLHADYSVALVYESVHMARIYANNDTWAVGVRAWMNPCATRSEWICVAFNDRDEFRLYRLPPLPEVFRLSSCTGVAVDRCVKMLNPVGRISPFLTVKPCLTFHWNRPSYICSKVSTDFQFPPPLSNIVDMNISPPILSRRLLKSNDLIRLNIPLD